MPKIIFPLVLTFFVLYIIWKVYSVYNENKKLNISFQALKEKNKLRATIFSPTKEIGDFKIDLVNNLFKFQGQIQLFEFSELLSFQLILNNKKIELPLEDIKNDFNINHFLIDINEINSLDLLFYTSGLNEGRYSYQFIYEPLNSESYDYNQLLQKVNKTILELSNIIKNQ
ncbi:hypothetical protein ACOXU5_00650 [Vagococcus fluvialis]|uniref:hypothetical protein n=1 Tax=Vagococcus fluvialis TaxID=2738 RepID=UPI003BF14C03